MNDGILQNLLKSVSESISDFIRSSLFIETSLHRAALKLCISKQAARYFGEHNCADKFCADKFSPLFAHTSIPTYLIHTSAFKQGADSTSVGYTTSTALKSTPPLTKRKRKESLPCSVHEFCTYLSQYLPWLQTIQKQNGKNRKQLTNLTWQIISRKVIPTSLLLLRLPNIRNHKKGTILPNHLNLTSLLFADILLQQVTSAAHATDRAHERPPHCQCMGD